MRLFNWIQRIFGCTTTLVAHSWLCSSIGLLVDAPGQDEGRNTMLQSQSMLAHKIVPATSTRANGCSGQEPDRLEMEQISSSASSAALH